MKKLIIAGVALAAVATGAAATGTGGPTSNGPLRCTITVEKAGGMTTLTGFVQADRKMSGAYSFRVNGSGGGNSTNISQGGAFTVVPGSSAVVGEVSLSGSSYKAELRIDAGGLSVGCTERA